MLPFHVIARVDPELIIAIVVFVIVILGKAASALFTGTRGGRPTKPSPRPPGGGKTPADEIKGFLSSLGIQVEEPQKPKPQPRPAQPPAQKPQPAQGARQQRPAPGGRTVHQADQDQVKSYLQSIGVQVEQKPPPRPAQRPTAQQRPAQRPAAQRRPQVAGAIPVVEVVEERPPTARVVQQPRSRQATPGPMSATRRTELAPATRTTALAPAARPTALATRPAGVLGTLGRLGKAPDLAELRRAIILTEIVRRPDFDRFPHDRLGIWP